MADRNWHDLHPTETGPRLWEMTRSMVAQIGDPCRQRCEDLIGLYQGTMSPDGQAHAALSDWWEDTLSTNVTQSCSDTLVAALLANRISPMFATHNGSWEDMDKARGMQRFVDALLDEAGVYGARGEETVSDSVILGLGATYVWADTASLRIVCDQVRPWEYLIHPEEAKLLDPPNQCLIQRVPRSQLLYQYADDEQALEAIRMADEATPSNRSVTRENGVADFVEVATWWHLPSCSVDRENPASWGHDGIDAVPHDGRKIAVLSGGYCLSTVAWPYPYAPIATCRPRRQRMSWRGRSIPEQLIGIQLEISRVEQQISQIINLWSRPLLYIWSQAGVNPHKVATNEVARVIQGRAPAGQALQYIVPQAVPGELWQQRQQKIQDAYDITGVSQMSASAKRPQGIEAAVAMQHLSDTESLRHTPSYRDLESYTCMLARLHVDAARILAEESEDYAVVFCGDKELEQVRWRDVDMADSKFRIRTAPAALLPKTPGARIDHAMKLITMGVIDPQEARMLFGEYSDFDRIMSDAQAAAHAADAHIRDALRGKPPAVSSYSDLATVKTRALAQYRTLLGRGAAQNSPELDALRKLLEMTEAQIPKPPPAPMPGAPMPAAPAPAPAGGPIQ